MSTATQNKTTPAPAAPPARPAPAANNPDPKGCSVVRLINEGFEKWGDARRLFTKKYAKELSYGAALVILCLFPLGAWYFIARHGISFPVIALLAAAWVMMAGGIRYCVEHALVLTSHIEPTLRVMFEVAITALLNYTLFFEFAWWPMVVAAIITMYEMERVTRLVERCVAKDLKAAGLTDPSDAAAVQDLKDAGLMPSAPAAIPVAKVAEPIKPTVVPGTPTHTVVVAPAAMAPVASSTIVPPIPVRPTTQTVAGSVGLSVPPAKVPPVPSRTINVDVPVTPAKTVVVDVPVADKGAKSGKGGKAQGLKFTQTKGRKGRGKKVVDVNA